MAAKTRELTAYGARKKKFLRRDFGDLEVQMGVRDVTSSIAVLGITDLIELVACRFRIRFRFQSLSSKCFRFHKNLTTSSFRFHIPAQYETADCT